MSALEAIMEMLGWKNKERDEKIKDLSRQLDETSGAIRVKTERIMSSAGRANERLGTEREGFRKLIELTEEALRRDRNVADN